MFKLKKLFLGLFFLITISIFVSASPYSLNYCVSGAGNTTANGVYYNDSVYGGCMYYVLPESNLALRFEVDNWTIIDGGAGQFLYSHPVDSGDDCLINDSWTWVNTSKGAAPAPTVFAGDCSTTTTTSITTSTTTTSTTTSTTTTLLSCLGNFVSNCSTLNESVCGEAGDNYMIIGGHNYLCDWYPGDGDPAVCYMIPVECYSGSTSGETYYTTNINWTYLASIITGSAVILGAILVVIIAVVPVLIVLALVSFIVGLYTAILGHVRDILK